MSSSPPALVNTTHLSRRWGVCTRTVLRVARLHGLTLIRLTRRGRFLLLTEEIAHLEAQTGIVRSR